MDKYDKYVTQQISRLNEDDARFTNQLNAIKKFKSLCNVGGEIGHIGDIRVEHIVGNTFVFGGVEITVSGLRDPDRKYPNFLRPESVDDDKKDQEAKEAEKVDGKEDEKKTSVQDDRPYGTERGFQLGADRGGARTKKRL